MNIKSKDEIRDLIAKSLLRIHNRNVEMRKLHDEHLEDMTYLKALFSQLLQPSSSPSQLVTKTPKILRKRAVQRIETIPEDEVLQQENISVDSLSINEQKQEEKAGGRLKRSAYKSAADNIKKQSITLSGRESFDENENVSAKKMKKDSQTKRKKYVTSNSDEEDNSKVNHNQTETKRSMRKIKKKSK